MVYSERLEVCDSEDGEKKRGRMKGGLSCLVVLEREVTGRRRDSSVCAVASLLPPSFADLTTPIYLLAAGKPLLASEARPGTGAVRVPGRVGQAASGPRGRGEGGGRRAIDRQHPAPTPAPAPAPATTCAPRCNVRMTTWCGWFGSWGCAKPLAMWIVHVGLESFERAWLMFIA